MSKLKAYREKNGFTQQELADKANLHIRYIAFLESGERNPSLKVASKLASILHATVEEIFLPNGCTKCT